MLAVFQDVHVMIFLGIGFLMTFLRKYGLSAVSLNLLCGALVVEVFILASGFLHPQCENPEVETSFLRIITEMVLVCLWFLQLHEWLALH